ncbi:MAG: metallopeptidase family protein [Myxococcales bacterium]|nr:metallopeptidase family protein [Myxococcales bacterium]
MRTASWLLGLLTIAACGDARRAPPPAPAPEPPAAAASATPPARADAATTPARDPLLGTCAVAAGAATMTADALVGALLDEAGQRLDAGAYADAFTCADMAADRAPRSIEAHHLRGAALAGAGRDDEARVAYDLALALDPEDPETLRAVADFYVNVIADKTRDTTALGLELARRGSARATARRRGQADLRAELALIEAQGWNDLGRADLALERAAAAVALDGTLTDALHEHGVALFNLGRFREAAARLEQVLAARPDEPYAHHMLGLALEQLGRGAEAATHFARARALAPDEFPPPVEITMAEMEAEIRRAVAALPPETRAKAALVPITVADVPDPTDLAASDPPFPPTILGLFRGLPLGASPEPGEHPPARAIVLYRMNLARAVRSRAELTEQIDRTIRHELGHLDGLDEDDLRRRDLE